MNKLTHHIILPLCRHQQLLTWLIFLGLSGLQQVDMECLLCGFSPLASPSHRCWALSFWGQYMGPDVWPTVCPSSKDLFLNSVACYICPVIFCTKTCLLFLGCLTGFLENIKASSHLLPIQGLRKIFTILFTVILLLYCSSRLVRGQQRVIRMLPTPWIPIQENKCRSAQVICLAVMFVRGKAIQQCNHSPLECLPVFSPVEPLFPWLCG